ncbi:hypothetical protein DSC45_03495 [Streptomyces sp. YIM 130001]|uniref:hypothetical protein n=1 Tax=Streptomyces sp. YIM 130001 TaxID=2259644 RepID=UPI000E64DE89|nr:hypothetical protein [Streptomyces sp. YIM 130001]RII20265.1 hypothetical protein DSC45_03495 [Streptomyces sp. YIM 130001]
MRAISAAAVTLLSAGALALAAPAAMAGDEEPGTNKNDITSFGFSVTPSTVAAGGQVTLKADGCDSAVKASSGVFDTVTVHKGKPATANVDWDAKPGAMYKVTFDCNGEKGTTDLTIASGGGGNPTTPPHHKGVNGGIGGSFSNLDLGEIALGGALIAGALGSAYYWARRRPDEESA